MRRAALLLVALALTGCESSQEKSAKLEKAAKLHESADKRARALAQKALTITHRSTRVRVLGTAVVSGAEGDAAVVTLHNDSASTIRDLPIAIAVKDKQGATVYANNTPGLAPTLLAVRVLAPHATLSWIDDQVQASAPPASVSAEVGEGTTAAGALPAVSVSGARLSEEAGSPTAEGTLVNRSSLNQQELVVYVVARRGGQIVGAGRAVLAEAPAGSSTHFQAFLVGKTAGAKLEVSAPPTVLG